MRSSGSCAPPPSPAKVARSTSSRRTSRCRRRGRRWRPTSWCRSTSAASWARRRASARCGSSSAAWSTPSPAGAPSSTTSPPTPTRPRSPPSSSTCWSSRRCRSTRRSGSTSASRRIRSARPASSTASTTRWSRSSAWPRPRACSSSTARARAPTCRRSAPRKELLNGGGTASGPVSFMKGFDAFAGVIKSGGKTRRAAKMVILNAEHPDIVEFINCKVNEEKKAWALIDAGYDGCVHRRGVRLGVLPELEQLGARHRRVHGRGGARSRVAHQERDHGRDRRHLPRARPVAADRRGGVAVR